MAGFALGFGDAVNPFGIRSWVNRLQRPQSRCGEEATARDTDSIATTSQKTQDIVDAFPALAGGLKVLQGLGRLARPIGYISTAIAAWRAAVAAVMGIWR